MDKYERYAVSHYLSQWPEELTEEHPEEISFDSIIQALHEDDQSVDITINEVYELYPCEDVASFIVDMVASLRRVFNEN